jgi:hypothetical protein
MNIENTNIQNRHTKNISIEDTMTEEITKTKTLKT